MPLEDLTSKSKRAFRRLSKHVLVLLFTVAGFAVMGYHPGLEDDGIYLSAVKSDLNPALYPHDAEFFRLQTQATVFDSFIAGFVRVTRIPVPWAELLWQFFSLYAILLAAHSVASRLFAERCTRWSSVALLAAMFTLPVAGTALYIADQHLHPRNMATALILLGVESTLAGRRFHALGLLVAALAMHPIMAAFGISFCLILGLVMTERIYSPWNSMLVRRPREMAAALPLGWIFEPPTSEWRRALDTRTYYFLYQWSWYEWLGAIGPLVLFWLLWIWMSAENHHPGPESLSDLEAAATPLESRPVTYHAERSSFQEPVENEEHVPGAEPRNACSEETARLDPCSFIAPDSSLPKSGRCGSAGQNLLLARFALALFVYGAFQLCVAMVVLGTPFLIRLTPLQPMRYLHLEYIFLVVIAGGLLGRHILGRSAWRWVVFLVAANAGMFLAAKILLPASEHLEMPWRKSQNAWIQAFQWIRQNTPTDAYFALDPGYLGVPGEDYHSFRALAERSQMADALKDAAVVTQVPELAYKWAEQADALAGWKQFEAADFERLKRRFGVDWVLVSYPPPARLNCKWHNPLLSVCRIPAALAGP